MTALITATHNGKGRNVVSPREAVIANLKTKGFGPDDIKKVEKALEESIPKKTYEVAVWFLGISTLILIIGAVVTLLLGKTTSDALWTCVGAGLGALAGIFTGKRGGN